MTIDKWDLDFLKLAKFWGELKSKDPSTKVGAIVTRSRHILGMGYNGFPKGVKDTLERLNDRPTKYALVVHAELNAILDCGVKPIGGTIYIWPLFSCANCAKAVIQSGIIRVVTPEPNTERWQSEYDTAMLMYHEAGIAFDLVRPQEEAA